MRRWAYAISDFLKGVEVSDSDLKMSPTRANTLHITDGDIIKDEEGQKSLATSLQPKQAK